MIALDGSEKFVYNIISFVCRRCTMDYVQVGGNGNYCR